MIREMGGRHTSHPKQHGEIVESTAKEFRSGGN